MTPTPKALAEAARVLRVGSAAAGALIYQASRGSYPDFYALNEAAMADLRQCAGKA